MDESADRRARIHLAWAEMSGWVFLALLVLSVLPSLNGLAPVVLLLALVVFPAVLVSLVRHRALRKITGAPVIGELREMIEPTAEMIAAHRAMYDEMLSMGAGDADAATRAEARQAAARGLKAQRQLRRHMLRHLELAALYERWGWSWARARYARKIAETVLILGRSHRSETS